MRKKKYNVTREMIAKIEEGQVFKSFADLSHFLGVLNGRGKPLTGDSKVQFLAELERYLEIHQDIGGYTLTVVKVRPENEILPPRSTGGNNKYSAILQNMLAYHILKKCKNKPCVELLWGTSDILTSCGMVDWQYGRWAKIDCKKEMRADALSFKYSSRSVMSKYIESAFAAMEKNGELVCEKRLVFVRINEENGNSTYYLPTPEEVAIYLKMRTQVIHTFKTASGSRCETEQDIFLSGLSDDYYMALGQEFSHRFPYNLALKMNYILTEPSSLQRTIKRTENVVYLDEFKKMNQLMCSNLPNLAVVKRGRKVPVPNPQYNPSDPKDQPEYLYEYKGIDADTMQLFIEKMIKTYAMTIPDANIIIQNCWVDSTE